MRSNFDFSAFLVGPFFGPLRPRAFLLDFRDFRAQPRFWGQKTPHPLYIKSRQPPALENAYVRV